jgi:hypothetical protein
MSTNLRADTAQHLIAGAYDRTTLTPGARLDDGRRRVRVRRHTNWPQLDERGHDRRTRIGRRRRSDIDRRSIMVPAIASRTPMSSPATVTPELVGVATCLSCHTEDATLSNRAVAAGADWRCRRCGQRWDASRLATAAAYASWLAASPSETPPPSLGSS